MPPINSFFTETPTSELSKNYCLEQKYWGRVRSASLQSDVSLSLIKELEKTNTVDCLPGFVELEKFRERSQIYESLKGRERELALEQEFSRVRQASSNYARKLQNKKINERRKALIAVNENLNKNLSTLNQKTKKKTKKKIKNEKALKAKQDLEFENCQRFHRLSDPLNLSTLEQFEKTFMISEIMASGASQQQIEAEIRICCVIQVKMWPIENKVPLSTSSLIDLLRMSRSWRKRAPDRPETKPTIVMSHNGISRCGIFIGANVCIDEMDMDHEVDVFHAVKMIRLNRPQLIDMKDEYKYLYDLMLHWYMNNPEYRVYEPPDNKQISSLNCYENEILHEAVDENESLTLNDSSQNNLKNQSFRQKSFCSHQQKDLNCTNFLKKTSSDTPKTIYLN